MKVGSRRREEGRTGGCFVYLEPSYFTKEDDNLRNYIGWIIKDSIERFE